MLNIGDIVKPKEGFKGNRYIFKIEFRDESNFPYMYRLGRVEQELDFTYGPIDFQRDIIREVEHLSWSENELELITPFYDVKPLVIKNKNLFDDGELMYNYYKNIKEDKTMKILELYKERKEEAILEDYEKKEEAILAEDEMQKIINEMTDQVNALLESENRTDLFYVESEGYTLAETDKKLDKLNEEKEDEILQLNKTVEEIEAMFEMTEDYEERMKILKKYGIINKDGKLSA